MLHPASFTGQGNASSFYHIAAGSPRVGERSLGYSDYIYEDGTDWLSRETWHLAISGNVFDLFRYWYANGRPSRTEYVLSAPSDFSIYYLQYNWHGDVVTSVTLDGSGSSTTMQVYGPWGNAAGEIAAWDYYRWNGGVGLKSRFISVAGHTTTVH